TLLLRPGRGRMTDGSKVLAGLAVRGRASARGRGTGRAVDCRVDRRRSDDAAALESEFRAGYSPGEERELKQPCRWRSTKAPRGRGTWAPRRGPRAYCGSRAAAESRNSAGSTIARFRLTDQCR